MDQKEAYIILKSLREAIDGLQRKYYPSIPKAEISMFIKYRSAFSKVLIDLKKDYGTFFSDLTLIQEQEYIITLDKLGKKEEVYSKQILDNFIVDIDYCINTLQGLSQIKILVNTYPLFRGIKAHLGLEISNAKKDIIVASAWLTDTDLINQLKERVESGLKVQIIIDSVDENFKITSHFDDFVKSGGELFVYSDKEKKCKMHHKFCVIDFKTTITGSYNWTFQANWNLENVIKIKSLEGLRLIWVWK